MSMLPCRRPGRTPLLVAALILLAMVLDVLCLLPHPVAAAPPGAPTKPPATPVAADGDAPQKLLLPGPPPIGLASWQVRKNYHERLQAWEGRVAEYRRNLSLADEELSPYTRPMQLATNPTASFAEIGTATTPMPLSPICALAAASVRERESARVEARLQGSGMLHLVLQLRDLYVYQSWDPFTFEAMKSRKAKKMTGPNGTVPPDDEVCNALIGSSSQSNKGWDKTAEGRAAAGTTYGAEVVQLYLIPLFLFPLVMYLFQEMWSWAYGPQDLKPVKSKRSR